MAQNFKNKTVVITGRAEGIGYGIADNCLENQAKLVIKLDINETQGLVAVKTLTTKYGNGKAVFYKCDVTADLEAVSKKIFSLYKVDVLFNNAGIFNDKLLKKTIDTNITAVVEWGLKLCEQMRKDKGGNGGTIVNLASIYGFRVHQFAPVYQASKFSVMGFTNSLGHEYNFERTGVAICPGYTETKMSSQIVAWDDSALDDLTGCPTFRVKLPHTSSYVFVFFVITEV